MLPMSEEVNVNRSALKMGVLFPDATTDHSLLASAMIQHCPLETRAAEIKGSTECSGGVAFVKKQLPVVFVWILSIKLPDKMPGRSA